MEYNLIAPGSLTGTRQIILYGLYKSHYMDYTNHIIRIYKSYYTDYIKYYLEYFEIPFGVLLYC